MAAGGATAAPEPQPEPERSRGELLAELDSLIGLTDVQAELHRPVAGLRVEGRLDARPRHAKAFDPDDPLHAARAAEVTSLWRLMTAD